MSSRLYVIFLLFAVNTSLIAPPVHAKSYTIPVIRVQVTVQPDGTVRIIEHRTYRFDGSFSWADYRLPMHGFSRIRNITVTEGGTSYRNQNSEAPGTFRVQRGDESLRMQWYYEAEDEERTFTIAYTLEGALVIGPEWVEFYWNYLSSDREKDTDRLTVTLTLPGTVSPDSLYTWKHGAREQMALEKSSSGYRLTARTIDEDESARVRSVFPRRLLTSPQVTTTHDSFSLNQAREDEQAIQQQRAREARYAGYGHQLLIVVCVLSIAAFIFFYRRYGKRHRASGLSGDATVMIPGRLKPAVAGWLLQGRTIHSGLLMATLLDLARRGYFTIRETEPEAQWMGSDKRRFRIEHGDSSSSSAGALTEWEQQLHTYVTARMDEGTERIDKLFSGSGMETQRWFSKWKKALKADGDKRGWYDQESKKGIYANLAVQLALMGAAIGATFLAGPTGLIGLGLTAIMMAASAAIYRRTPEGERTYRQWKAYREGLSNAPDHAIQADLLDRHFIYAVAFGLSQQQVEELFSQCSAEDAAFYWVIFSGHAHTGGAAAMAASFSTLSASGTAAFPGAAASGAAGATAGAAGGGAAGGAG